MDQQVAAAVLRGEVDRGLPVDQPQPGGGDGRESRVLGIKGVSLPAVEAQECPGLEAFESGRGLGALILTGHVASSGERGYPSLT